MIIDGYSQYVASNLKLPLRIQSQIVHGNDNRAKSNLAQNKAIDISMFEKLSKSGNYTVITSILNNLLCPANILRKFAESHDKNTLIALTCNPNTPADVIINLTQNNDVKVREYATFYLKERGLA
jgi:hypothetical protein